MHGVPRGEVVLDRLVDQVDEVAVLADQDRDEQVADLLLRVLVGGEQVHGLHVAEVDVVAEEEDEEQLADVLLLLVAVQGLVPLELGPDVGQLLVDPLDLCLLGLAVADVGDEDGQAAHPVAAHRRHDGVEAKGEVGVVDGSVALAPGARGGGGLLGGVGGLLSTGAGVSGVGLLLSGLEYRERKCYNFSFSGLISFVRMDC